MSMHMRIMDMYASEAFFMQLEHFMQSVSHMA
jgi:hypothetical protein